MKQFMYKKTKTAKILSAIIAVALLAGMLPFAAFATDPEPIFTEDFENLPADSDNTSPWERNSTYVSGGGTHNGQTIGYGDNYPGPAFTDTQLNYMDDKDPQDPTNTVLNTGLYDMNKFIIGRDLPGDCANKVIEVYTYFDQTMPKKSCEFVLKVGEVKINVNGWGLDNDINNSETGFSYKVQAGAQTPIKWNDTVAGVKRDLHYPGTSFDMNVSDGWHQFVFDYTGLDTDEEGKTTVNVYLNGVQIINTVVDETINGTYNRANGTRISFGDGQDGADGVNNYYLDNIRVWNSADLNYVLGLHTAAPTASAAEGKPIYEQNFNLDYGFNGWSSLLTRTARWRMTNTDKTKAIAADPDTSKTDNYVLRPDTHLYPVYNRLAVAEKNKAIEIWFYDDPEVLKTDKEAGIYPNAGVYVGNNMVSGSYYFIGVSQLSEAHYSGEREANYSIMPAGGNLTATTIARTKGWHQFVFDFTGVDTESGNRNYGLYIDGQLAGSGTASAADIYCHDITIGDIWAAAGKGSAMYYDDLRVWNSLDDMVGVRKTELEEAAIVDKNADIVLGTDDLFPAQQIETKVSVLNSVQGATATVALAVYSTDSEGSFTKLDSLTVGTPETLPVNWAKATELTPVGITLGENDEDYLNKIFRVFVFDSMGGLNPLGIGQTLFGPVQ